MECWLLCVGLVPGQGDDSAWGAVNKEEKQVRPTSVTESFLDTLPNSLGPDSTHLTDEEIEAQREEAPGRRAALKPRSST